MHLNLSKIIAYFLLAVLVLSAAPLLLNHARQAKAASLKYKTAAVAKAGAAKSSVKIRGSLKTKKPQTNTIKVTAASTASTTTNPAAENSNSAYLILSSYYISPGQSFSVFGRRFLPNEEVEVRIGTTAKTVKADKNGEFSVNNIGTDLGSLNNVLLISATGKTSGQVNPITLKVGSFYPFVSPSSYYLHSGERVSFNGIRFAPGEQVSIESGKQVLATVSADSSGSLTTPQFDVPGALGDKTYTFTGQTSKLSYQVKIKIGQKQ